MERIDNYTFSRAHPLPTGSSNTQLYWAKKDFDPKQIVCQIVDFDPRKKPNVQECINRLEFLRGSHFGGFLVIDHYRILDKCAAVFFEVTGTVESLGAVLHSGYILSNFEVVRLGVMLLDCYQIFYQANIVIQEIE